MPCNHAETVFEKGIEENVWI